ncbi:hypothetical protein U1Q18_035024, partial [Sarracenia purpurea var. burkii]
PGVIKNETFSYASCPRMTKKFAHNSQGKIGCSRKSPACYQIAINNYSCTLHCFIGELAYGRRMSSGSLILFLSKEA